MLHLVEPAVADEGAEGEGKGKMDGSLHAALPPEVAASAIEAGWAEPHRLALRGVVPGTIVMLYGPRDLRELEVIGNLVAVSFEFARGRNGAGGKGE